MTNTDQAALLATMTDAALAAGKAILEIYSQPIESETKSDGSPVTIADEAAEKLILEYLAPLGIPVLAEESVAAGNIPELGNRFFVVDPLDGTKEFIKRNGEFTVNIALVENGNPTLGVVTAPALDKGYRGSSAGAEAFAIEGTTASGYHPISVDRSGPMRVVASRSHGHAALNDLCEELEVIEDVSVGSSLKFCLIAEGRARIYPRFTPTCEWDTAAGQAVLQAAGGAVVTLTEPNLGYAKTGRKFLNPYFVAADNQELALKTAAIVHKLVGSEGE